MEQLNLPTYQFRWKKEGDKNYIFDEVRKKFILCTPEEWVRQNFIKFLINEKGFPPTLISIEAGYQVNKRIKRTDILIYNRCGETQLIVECKAPKIKISQATFDQIATYNMQYNVKYLLVTNGLQHYGCIMDYENETYNFLQDIPHFSSL